MDTCKFKAVIKGNLRCASRDHTQHTTDILMANPTNEMLECEGLFDPNLCECYSSEKEYEEAIYNQFDEWMKF